MNKTISIFVLVFCCASLGVNSSVQEQFTISRIKPRDSFKISATTCNVTNSSKPCSDFGTRYTLRWCHCQCSYKNPSFMYRSGKWGCVSDKLTKKREDCGFWNSSTSLRFVNDVSSTEVIVPTAQNLQASRCLVDHAGSSYLACDGAWKPIGTSASTSSTQFKLTFVSATASEWKHKLHVNATTGAPDLRGRIVKLAITCSPTTGHPCMLFKIEGDFKCPVDPTKPDPTEILTTQTEESPSTDPTTGKLMSRPTSENFPPSYTSNGNKEARKSEQTSANVWAIAGGVVASTVLLVILCCVAVCCVRRRKQRLLKKNFYKVNRPPTPPLNNSDRGEKVQMEKLNFRYVPAQPNPIYEGIDDVKLAFDSCEKITNKTQEPQYMNLSFKGGIKLGVHGLPPVKPARASLKREPNRVNAARDVNNAGFKNEPQNNPVEPLSSSPEVDASEPEQVHLAEEASNAEQPSSGPEGETYVKMDDSTDDSEYGDEDSNEWDSCSEADNNDEQIAHAQEQPETGKPEEVIYATINDAGASNFVNEVMNAFQQIDTK